MPLQVTGDHAESVIEILLRGGERLQVRAGASADLAPAIPRCTASPVDERMSAPWLTMTMQPFSVPGLNTRDLQALVAIAHFRSLIGAAAFLQTSQSALSRTVTS